MDHFLKQYVIRILASIVIALWTGCKGGPIEELGDPDDTPTLADCWTPMEPSSTSLIVYVSTSGNDANDGLTEQTPKQTIAAGFALLRDGFPDWLLLRRGDTFTLAATFTWNKSGPASASDGWMHLGAYGNETDPRPVIDTGEITAFMVNPGFGSTKIMRNIAFTDIHLLASTRMNNPPAATTSARGIHLLATNWQGTGYPFSNVLVENMKFQGYSIGVETASGTEDLLVRSCIFYYIFVPDGSTGGAFGWIGSPTGALLENNIFYQIQSSDIPGVVNTAYSGFMHSAYITADARDVVTRGNIVIKATEAFMQRAGGIYSRNVGAHCAVAGLLGQTWGVTPPPGGVEVTFEESLLLNAFDQPFYLGNTANGIVRDNLLVRDQQGTYTFGVSLVPINIAGSGTNIGVHNTNFSNNHMSGAIAWSQSDTASFSGLTFTGNQENIGTVNTNIGTYLASIGWTGSTVDDWATQLMTHDRANCTEKFETASIINFYRTQMGLQPLP
ncbi:MAG: hypothetical protein L0Y80_11475 [Ignavibacteriae bacterium]|nr:hypothetical protein [Ignavibacteriota bacterium]